MQFMRLTGGKLVATTHRVNTLKIDQDRYVYPDIQCEVPNKTHQIHDSVCPYHETGETHSPFAAI